MCNNCFDNCPGTPVSDRCVKYTGSNIPALGISTGDTLFSVENIIITKLLETLEGTEIDLSDTSVTCEFLTTILAAKDKTLANLMQMLVTASCTLRQLITEIDNQINAPYSFNTSCLSVTSTATRDDILQAAIVKLCSVSTDLSTIKGDYVKKSELCSLVSQCLSSIPSNNQEYTKMAKYRDWETDRKSVV